MNHIFTNAQIDIEDLPHLAKMDFNPISRNYLKLLVIQKSIFIVIIFIAWIIGNQYMSELELSSILNIGFPIILFLLIISLVITIIGFKKRKYAIRERDITYSLGLLKHSTLVVPFKRIQHIELNQSFLDKKFDVATLKIYTAGESGGDLRISGLHSKVAEDINGFLSKKINDLD